jgi:hypothetical protein
MERMRRTVEEQLRSELNDALAKHNKSTWRDMFCCCFPRKQGVRRGCACNCAVLGMLYCFSHLHDPSKCVACTQPAVASAAAV